MWWLCSAFDWSLCFILEMLEWTFSIVSGACLSHLSSCHSYLKLCTRHQIFDLSLIHNYYEGEQVLLDVDTSFTLQILRFFCRVLELSDTYLENPSALPPFSPRLQQSRQLLAKSRQLTMQRVCQMFPHAMIACFLMLWRSLCSISHLFSLQKEWERPTATYSTIPTATERQQAISCLLQRCEFQRFRLQPSVGSRISPLLDPFSNGSDETMAPDLFVQQANVGQFLQQQGKQRSS